MKTLLLHPDCLVLYKSCLENPADDAPRLVLVDWLLEDGQEELAGHFLALIRGSAARIGLRRDKFFWFLRQFYGKKKLVRGGIVKIRHQGIALDINIEKAFRIETDREVPE